MDNVRKDAFDELLSVEELECRLEMEALMVAGSEVSPDWKSTCTIEN